VQKNSANRVLISTIIFLILLIIGGSGAAFWYMTKPPKTPKQTQKAKQKDLNGKEKNLAQIGPLYPLKPIALNLKNPDGKRIYLKVTFSLELSNRLLSHELDAKDAIIRDRIMKIFSARTTLDMDSALERNRLCKAIKESLNAIITDGKIKNVYIINKE